MSFHHICKSLLISIIGVVKTFIVQMEAAIVLSNEQSSIESDLGGGCDDDRVIVLTSSKWKVASFIDR